MRQAFLLLYLSAGLGKTGLYSMLRAGVAIEKELLVTPGRNSPQQPDRRRFMLHSKTCPASAGIAGIRITESKAAVVQSIYPIYLHPVQINLMGAVHRAGNAFYFK